MYDQMALQATTCQPARPSWANLRTSTVGFVVRIDLLIHPRERIERTETRSVASDEVLDEVVSKLLKCHVTAEFSGRDAKRAPDMASERLR